MPLRLTLPILIALLAGVVPVLAANLGYLISLHYEVAAVCNPYLQGCLSVSAANRNEPAIFLFRALMIPEACLLAAHWWLAQRWLAELGDRSRRALAVQWVGLIGALFLILYVVFLGTVGEVYQFMRRFGITIFFAFTFLAQLLYVERLVRARAAQLVTAADRSISVLLWLTVGLLGAGLASIPVQHIWDLNTVENVIEWWFSLALAAFFPINAWIWWRDGMSLDISRGPTAG